MANVYVLNKKKMYVYTAAAILLFAAVIYFTKYSAEAIRTGASQGQERVIEMVTGEFKTSTPDGQEIESYRWDPGTVFVKQGDHVTLKIHGISGQSHPFEIEGLGIQGVVNKGEETVVEFTADKEGIYRIVCHTHSNHESNGPMVGYLVVQ